MTDTFTVRLVVAALALISILSLVGGGFLAFAERQVPDFLIGMGTGSMGAIAGILSRTSSKEEK